MHNDAQISNAQIEQDTTADENLISCIDNPYFCSVGNIPNNFYDEYVNIEKSVTQNDFSLQARVMAGLNMASAVSFACNSKINTYTSADVEDYYVSIRTGDIKIFVEIHESQDSVAAEDEDGNTLYDAAVPKEGKMLSLVAYLTFRLLCLVDPFDGKQTLVEYPLLSKTATAKIHSGQYRLIVETGENTASRYLGSEALNRWNALPNFFREQLVKALCAQSDNCEIDGVIWLDSMRKLRDCLVFVKGQYRFCDLDLPINLLYMKMGSYKVPVWPKKALYWYHIGDDAEKAGSGVIAGVNSEGTLENFSDLTWCIEYGTMKEFISPKHSVKPESGMLIKMKDDVVVEIVDGNIVLPKNTESDAAHMTDIHRDDSIKEGSILQDEENAALQNITVADNLGIDNLPIGANIVIDHSD
jgi:hypothetical protein